ncbi:hypothetical protein D931_02695 [Enterococcus faecium 13.SD.W.09]|nr:hypothetical protein D931_02695 [Enterococcus faecium 13.SD.W.09]
MTLVSPPCSFSSYNRKNKKEMLHQYRKFPEELAIILENALLMIAA